MASLFDHLFPGNSAIYPETPFALMGLNALAYLDPADFLDDVKTIFGADSGGMVEGEPAAYIPNVLWLRSGNRVILSYQGTVGTAAWFYYIAGAGALPYGPDPGRCYAPFVTIANKVWPDLEKLFTNADRLLFTGHSLGAAIASMHSTELTRFGLAVDPCWPFACPRFADSSYLAMAPGRSRGVNLPYDPVPLLPPNVVDYLGSDITQIRWDEVYATLPGRLAIGAVEVGTRPFFGLDYLVVLAAGSLPFRTSQHQTYNYIRACWHGLGTNATLAALQLAAVLTGLGLFDPWPAPSQLERRLMVQHKDQIAKLEPGLTLAGSVEVEGETWLDEQRKG